MILIQLLTFSQVYICIYECAYIHIYVIQRCIFTYIHMANIFIIILMLPKYGYAKMFVFLTVDFVPSLYFSKDMDITLL